MKTIESKWKYLKEEYSCRKNGLSGSGGKNECALMKLLRFLDDIVFYQQ